MPRHLLKLAAAAVSTYAALVAADLIVMWPPPAPDRMPRGLYQVDATRGYSHVPGTDLIVKTRVSYRVTINARGYRDREWDVSNPFRVLVAGDSFTFGQGLPVDDGFVRQAERLLGGRATLYNAGVSGYGLGHVRQTVIQELPFVRPAHVFYMYFVNDISWKMRTDFATVADGYLVSAYEGYGARKYSAAEISEHVKNQPRRPLALGQVLGVWHLRVYLWDRSWHPTQLLGFSPRPAPQPAHYSNDAEYPAANVALGADAIVEMQDEARRHGAGFTMVILPSRDEASAGYVEPATTKLLGALDGRGVDIIDLRQSAARGVDPTLGWEPHYNAAAGAWVAAAMVRRLRELYPAVR